MKRPSFYITEENFNELVRSDFWTIKDLPPNRAAQLRGFLNNADSIGVFASGVAPHKVEGREPVGGIDWVRLEAKPVKGEPPLNFYHFVIHKPDASGYPVYGPIKDGTVAPHWGDLPDLDRY